MHGKIWNVFQDMMSAQQWNPTSVWGTEDFFSIAALFMVSKCTPVYSNKFPYFSEPLLINVTPVVHKETKSLESSTRCVKKRFERHLAKEIASDFSKNNRT